MGTACRQCDRCKDEIIAITLAKVDLRKSATPMTVASVIENLQTPPAKIKDLLSIGILENDSAMLISSNMSIANLCFLKAVLDQHINGLLAAGKFKL